MSRYPKKNFTIILGALSLITSTVTPSSPIAIIMAFASGYNIDNSDNRDDDSNSIESDSSNSTILNSSSSGTL
jgi:hypothetical protein